jgi:hypothetical protein
MQLDDNYIVAWQWNDENDDYQIEAIGECKINHDNDTVKLYFHGSSILFKDAKVLSIYNGIWDIAKVQYSNKRFHWDRQATLLIKVEK